MIRRVFWTGIGVGFGATAGVLAGAVSGLGDAIRDFGAEVRAGMAEREAELNDALGFSGDPYPDEPLVQR